MYVLNLFIAGFYMYRLFNERHIEYITKIRTLFTNHPITFRHKWWFAMMKHLVDSATCLLIISANRMPISLLHRVQIAVKDEVLNLYNLDFAWKAGCTCIFHLGDDRNGLILPQAHLPVADSNSPFSILFSHAHHGYFAQLFSMNWTQVEGGYCLYRLASQKGL